MLGFVSTILLFPHILESDQYGLTRLLMSLALVCAQFSHLGIKNVVIRYYPYFQQSDTSRQSLLTLTIVISMAGFGLFLALYFVFDHILVNYYTDKSTLFAKYSTYLPPLVLFILFFETLNSYVRALKDSVTGSFVNEVLVRTLIIILLIVFDFRAISFTQFMILFVLIYGIQPFYLLIYLYKRSELSFASPFRSSSRRLLKGMSAYGLYSLLGGVTALLVGNIDIIMLSAMTDLTSTAVYAIAFYVGSVIAIPQRSIGKIATPILATFLKEKKYQDIGLLYEKTSLNQIIAGSLLLLGIWANMHNLMDLLPPEYQGSKWVIIIIGFAKLFDMATGINGGIILNSSLYRFDLYTNILLVLLAIGTNYLLIPIYGIVGAAVATAGSVLIYNLVKLLFVWVKFSLQPFRWSALSVLIIAGGCLALSFQIPYMLNFFIDLTVRSLIITVIFFSLILAFNLSSDVTQLFRSSLRKAKGYLSSQL